jgi:hypothetical protein
MSPTREFNGVAITLPEIVQTSCGLCKKPMKVTDDLYLNEDDAVANIGLHCPRCRAGSSYYWRVSDVEYEYAFGHVFGRG